jgi:hypothetical protein
LKERNRSSNGFPRTGRVAKEEEARRGKKK